MSSDPVHAAFMIGMDEDAVKTRRSKLTPAQEESLQLMLDIAYAYVSGDMSLADATHQTVGGWLRYKVTTLVVPGTEDYRVWHRLIDDIVCADPGNVATKYGIIRSDVLIGDRQRARVVSRDVGNGEIIGVEVWEQQYCEDGTFYWPSERRPGYVNPRRLHSGSGPSIRSQIEAWDDPENAPGDL